jgi:hypothetical protein
MTRSPRRLSIDGVHYAVLLIREQDVRSAYVPRRAVRLLKGLDVFQTERVLPGIFQHHPQPGERFAALHRHDRAPEAGPVAGRIDVTGGIIDKGLQTCSDSDHNGREWTS